jgi:hypothetical protein
MLKRVPVEVGLKVMQKMLQGKGLTTMNLQVQVKMEILCHNNKAWMLTATQQIPDHENITRPVANLVIQEVLTKTALCTECNRELSLHLQKHCLECREILIHRIFHLEETHHRESIFVEGGSRNTKSISADYTK